MGVVRVRGGGRGVLSRQNGTCKSPEKRGTGMDAIAPNLPAGFSQRNPFYHPSQKAQKGVLRSRGVSRRGSAHPGMSCAGRLEHRHMVDTAGGARTMMCTQISLGWPHPGPHLGEFPKWLGDCGVPTPWPRSFSAPWTLSLAQFKVTPPCICRAHDSFQACSFGTHHNLGRSTVTPVLPRRRSSELWPHTVRSEQLTEHFWASVPGAGSSGLLPSVGEGQNADSRSGMLSLNPRFYTQGGHHRAQSVGISRASLRGGGRLGACVMNELPT